MVLSGQPDHSRRHRESVLFCRPDGSDPVQLDGTREYGSADRGEAAERRWRGPPAWLSQLLDVTGLLALVAATVNIVIQSSRRRRNLAHEAAAADLARRSRNRRFLRVSRKARGLA